MGILTKMRLMVLLAAAVAFRLSPPARFTGEFDDSFTADAYKNYATKDEKSGQAVITRANALKLAEEVINTELTPRDEDGEVDFTMGMNKRQRLTYLDNQFDKAFSHFDVLSQGFIAADQAAAFSRFLLKDQYVQLAH